jgi:hypothetical protein
MGVREAKYRIAKYRVKKYETKGKKLSPETEEKTKDAFTKLVALENAIKEILSKTALPTYMNISYLNFGREVYGLTRRHTGDELNMKIESVMAKWLGRKLDKVLLENIKKCALDFGRKR